MDVSANKIAELFRNRGGEFLSSPDSISNRLKDIKAILFDWDGVFNEGSKGGNSQSGFSEVDSMGTNMLRFSQWLLHDKKMPYCGILTGADNYAAYDFAKREHFRKVYFKVPNKIDALNHIEEVHKIKPEEVLYVYDDILDLSVAQKVGIRIFVRSHAKVLFSEFVRQNDLADYITAYSGGEHAVRETCELLMGLNGQYNRVIQERVDFSADYQEYLNERNKPATTFYTIGKTGVIIEHHVA
ncbi:MAG: phosphatase [Crocinitomicaceae bacterium]|nr:phosphatase [Crocinitomicaceae bacterium]|tara:strand:- start:5151 stop:5876 length:726 start_codon:yes stop_codon:yes gene_type:complete